MSWGGCNYDKLKTNLRLSINRLKLLEKKKTELALKSRKEIADYISAGKEDRARIRVEHIIREDYMVEAMEMVEMYCDLMLARLGLIKQTQELDEGLEEPVSSVIWASFRLQADVPELKVVVDQLRRKYSKEFVEFCQRNEHEAKINEKLLHKLGVEAPPKQLVEMYMEEIAKSYNVPFTPDRSVMSVDALAVDSLLLDVDVNKGGRGGGGGGGMPVMQAQAPGQMPPPPGFIDPQNNYPQPPVPTVAPVGPATYNPPAPGPATAAQPPAQAKGNDMGLPELPSVPDSVPVGGATAKGGDVDFDDLTRRFEELKKRK